MSHDQNISCTFSRSIGWSNFDVACSALLSLHDWHGLITSRLLEAPQTPKMSLKQQRILQKVLHCAKCSQRRVQLFWADVGVTKYVLFCAPSSSSKNGKCNNPPTDSSIHHHPAANLLEQVLLASFVLLPMFSLFLPTLAGLYLWVGKEGSGEYN